MAADEGRRSGIRESLGLLLLRAGAGGMLCFGHGLDKLTHFAEWAATFPDPLGLGTASSMALAVFGEFFCALFVMIGLATRLSAIPPAMTMLVAAFIVHAPDPWARKELALIYAVPFLALILAGGGRFSIDAVYSKKT